MPEDHPSSSPHNERPNDNLELTNLTSVNQIRDLAISFQDERTSPSHVEGSQRVLRSGLVEIIADMVRSALEWETQMEDNPKGGDND